jgi:hypothetical protein
MISVVLEEELISLSKTCRIVLAGVLFSSQPCQLERYSLQSVIASSPASYHVL